jgi:hypothetical protein
MYPPTEEKEIQSTDFPDIQKLLEVVRELGKTKKRVGWKGRK